VRWGEASARAVRGAVLPAAAAAAAAAVLLTTLPARAPVALRRAPAGDAVAASAVPAATADPLARLRVTVTPPAYAGQRARTLDAPTGVAALVGSTLVVEGAGDGSRVRATLDAGTGGPEPELVAVPGRAAARGDAPRPAALPVRRDGASWRVALAMPSRPAVLRLAGPARARLVVLEPQADLPPRVTLDRPVRDTVLRTPAGAVPLRARADDDLALADGHFEWVVSSGEGENFTFRSGRLGGAAFGGARGALAAGLDLGALALKPGDVVHVRAVVRDRRPGRRARRLETRRLRVARAGEYDSVAVEGAPPPAADTTALGQRMLLQLTEALVARARARRAPLGARPWPPSRGGSPPTRPAPPARGRRGVRPRRRARARRPAPSTPTSTATGTTTSPPSACRSSPPSRCSPPRAVPPAAGRGRPPSPRASRPWWPSTSRCSRRTTTCGTPAARSRSPSRRGPSRRCAGRSPRSSGRAPPSASTCAAGRRRPVVDVNKVRLAGGVNGDTLAPAPRTAALYAALDPAARGRALALDRALAGLARGGAPAADAADSLALLRVRALGDAPALAAALGDALAALAGGGDASAPLARARRAAGAPAAPGGRAGGAAAWSAPWADLRP
jgi:hypothetical protein